MADEQQGGGSTEGASGSDESNAAPASINVEIDGQERTLTGDDVRNLVAQQASATQKTQEVAAIKNIADKHDMTPQVFAEQVSDLLGQVARLQDKGIIDENGDIVEQTTQQETFVPENKTFDFGDTGRQEFASAKTEQVVQAALKGINEKLAAVESSQQKMNDNNAMILQTQIERQIQADNPELSIQDASYIIDKAQDDMTKPLAQHIEDFKVTKKDYNTGQEKKYAEHFGVNLETFNANRLREQDAKGGGLAGLFKGKKFSFKKGNNSIDPRQALQETLKGRLGG